MFVLGNHSLSIDGVSLKIVIFLFFYFLRSVMSVIDFVAIMPYYIGLTMSDDNEVTSLIITIVITITTTIIITTTITPTPKPSG